ncbi:hypothetical protein U1Q18_006678 [Sarracenia purpurea var. burkii]
MPVRLHGDGCRFTAIGSIVETPSESPGLGFHGGFREMERRILRLKAVSQTRAACVSGFLRNSPYQSSLSLSLSLSQVPKCLVAGSACSGEPCAALSLGPLSLIGESPRAVLV